jgi:enoyl-CoA hydratase
MPTDTDLYEGETVSVERIGGGVLSLRLDPDAVVGGRFRRDLRRAVDAIAGTDAGAVVLTGRPGAFDLAPEGGSDRDSAAGPFPSRPTRQVLAGLETVSRPVVAALRGPVSDVGLLVALRADLRLGGRTSTYGTSSPDDPPSDRERRRLEATIGRDRAAELSSGADRRAATTLEDWGYLNAVEPDGRVFETAVDRARTFAGRSGIPYRYIKSAVRVRSRVESHGGVGSRTPPARTDRPSALERDLEWPAADASTVSVDEPRSGIVRLTLDRRRKLNALDGPMIAALRDALDEVEALDPDAVVVASAGDRAFSIGLDVRAPIARSAGSEAGLRIAHLGQRITETLASLRVPVVAAVSGRTFGGGFEVAMAADVRIAGESSTYGLPEVTHGLLPAAGGTQRLPRLVGTGRATELLFSGDTVGASTMADWGALSSVVPDEAVSEAALDVAERAARDGVGDRDRPRFLPGRRPPPEGLLLERLGLGHAFSRDPFDVTDADAER